MNLKATVATFMILSVVGIALAKDKTPPPGTEPKILERTRLDLVDGSTISGKIAMEHLTVKTEYGVLKVPISALVSITPGLDSDPELAERAGTLVARLASDKVEQRDQAQKELIEIGPRLKQMVSEHASDDSADVKARIGQILKAYETWAAQHPEAPKWAAQPVGRLDQVQTVTFSFVGRIADKQFKITTDYGTMTAGLSQVRQVQKVPIAAPVQSAHTARFLLVELRDGSRLKGDSKYPGFSLETPYGRADIPLDLISTASFGDDGKTADLALKNGDRVLGQVDLSAAKLELKTSFGVVSVPMKEVARIEVTSEPSAEIRKGLVLHFSFDEKSDKVKDLSGKENHGAVCEAQYTPKGRFGGAYVLDGENDHIEIPNSESLEIRQELTLAVWVKLASFGPGGYGNEHGYILNKGDDLWWNPAFCLGYAKASGAGAPRWPGQPGPYPALFHVCNETGSQNGGGKTVASTTLLEPGKWYHIAGTYDGSTVKIYVNGRLEAQEKYSGLLRSDHAPVHLGGGKLYGTDWGNQFTVNGVLDEVMIWNRALAADEIASICGK